jgi:hypothetical protein
MSTPAFSPWDTLRVHIPAKARKGTPFAVVMVDSGRMFSLDDDRWTLLAGGYKSPFDPRPALAKLSNRQDEAAAWEELWEELHHQGDVGEASYAAIPELVRIHRSQGSANWNLYAMTAIIELARTESGNPEVPEWLREDYFRSIHELAEMGAKEIWSADDPETIRAVLSVIAIAKGLRTHGKFLVEYSEDEVSALNLDERK